MTDLGGKWCILRMSAGATVPVVTSLTETGLEAWTPVVMETKNVGPSRKVVKRPAPLLPSLAFARADRLHELVVMSHAPALTSRRYNRDTGRMEIYGCPRFSIFRDQGHYPLIADRQLEPLRRAAHKGRSREVVHVFQPGDAVRKDETNFSGMVGTIQTVSKREAYVLFPGASIPWKLQLCDLIPVEGTHHHG